MKAAVFLGGGKPMEIRDVPTPEPGPGEVRVRVAACGVCHTDLHYLDHGVPTFKKPPVILGHEASGAVDAVGGGVTSWKEGDQVLLPAVVTCGECEMCRRGRENICQKMRMFGNHMDGAYAEYVLAPAKDIFAVPGSLDLAKASIIADAVSTPYHAVVHRARVKPGDRVVVFGCGGVGLNVVQIAAAVGGNVLAVDIDDGKLETARQLGATQVLNTASIEKPSKEIRKAVGGGGPDIAMEAIGNPVTIRQAYDCVRPGGRVCVIGYSDKTVEIPASRLMFFELEVVGSLGCRPVDYPKIIDLAARGWLQLDPLITGTFPLEEIGKAMDLLRDGKALRSLIVP